MVVGDGFKSSYFVYTEYVDSLWHLDMCVCILDMKSAIP